MASNRSVLDQAIEALEQGPSGRNPEIPDAEAVASDLRRRSPEEMAALRGFFESYDVTVQHYEGLRNGGTGVIPTTRKSYSDIDPNETRRLSNIFIEASTKAGMVVGGGVGLIGGAVAGGMALGPPGIILGGIGGAILGLILGGFLGYALSSLILLVLRRLRGMHVSVVSRYGKAAVSMAMK